MAQRKAQTVADLVAAAEMGAVDLSTEVLTVAEAAKRERKAAQAAAEQAAAQMAPTVAAAAPLSTTKHDCGVAGCRHGTTGHPVVHQPDRQVKLQCPHCGAVARMTGKALAASGGIKCETGGVPFAIAERRTYVRKSGAAATVAA